MKQWVKFQFIFLFFVTFFLLFFLPVQIQPKTDDDIEYKIDELEYEIDTFTVTIEDCEDDLDRIDEEIRDLEIERLDFVPVQLDGYDFIDRTYCNYKSELDKLGDELDKLTDPSADVTLSEEQRKKIEELKVKLEELKVRNDDLQKRKKEFEDRIKKLREGAKNTVHSELASEIIKIMKPVLEKVCGGQLEVRVLWDKIERNIHVISIEFGMEVGKQLDDNWRPNTVKSLREEANILAKVVGNSVRADGQNIFGRVANSFQIVTAEDTEGEALATLVVNKIAVTVSFLENKVKKY